MGWIHKLIESESLDGYTVHYVICIHETKGKKLYGIITKNDHLVSIAREIISHNPNAFGDTFKNLDDVKNSCSTEIEIINRLGYNKLNSKFDLYTYIHPYYGKLQNI